MTWLFFTRVKKFDGYCLSFICSFVQGYWKFNSYVCWVFFAFFRKKVNFINIYLGRILYGIFYLPSCQTCGITKCLQQLSGDIELNPGRKPSSCQSFSIFHWNLNSITCHTFIKVSLLAVYNSIHKFGIICLSETCLNFETLSNNKNLNVPGHNLIRADHLPNNKREGVCIYLKKSLQLRLYIVSYLNECILFEIMIANKLCNFISLYRSPS